MGLQTTGRPSFDDEGRLIPALSARRPPGRLGRGRGGRGRGTGAAEHPLQDVGLPMGLAHVVGDGVAVDALRRHDAGVPCHKPGVLRVDLERGVDRQVAKGVERGTPGSGIPWARPQAK